MLWGDLIIPKDEVSGSASDAKVIDFLDFIVKDIPEYQVPLRGGLKWLDMQCLNRYGHSFVGSAGNQQVEILEEIAYPMKVKPEMHPGAVFFYRLRNLVATGFQPAKLVSRISGMLEMFPENGMVFLWMYWHNTT